MTAVRANIPREGQTRGEGKTFEVTMATMAETSAKPEGSATWAMLPFDQQFQQPRIDFVAFDGLVDGAWASMLDDAELAFEIPQRISPAELLEDGKQILEPSEGDIVWGAIMATEFADMNSHSFALNLPPGFIKLA